ncbi:hypothetical protein N7448_008339 [Penicillium atrosanguineum]|nr:hypothetical protein N7448_008339 [Penicillium atrosanguineum]KAJ5147767.1 hypothetical protein N7526_001119 [Penicillium atrosanguineum]
MDPVTAFGIVSGGVQVVQAIASTVHDLNQLYGKFKDADLTIQSLIQELSCISTALTGLKEWTRTNGTDGPSSDEYNRDLAVAMEGCRVVMEVVSHDISHLVQGIHEEQFTGFRARMRIVWSEETMRGHQEKLHAQVSALQLLLQVCQCRSFTEQMRMLRTPNTRRIIHRVADDTATILSARGSSYATSVSQSRRQSISARSVDFNQTLEESPVYQWAQKQRVSTFATVETPPTVPSSNRSPFTNETRSSSPATSNMTIPSLKISPQQEGNYVVPRSPSGPVHHPVHSKSVSIGDVSRRPNLGSLQRHVSDSKVPSRSLRRSGSTLDKIKGLMGRPSTRTASTLSPSHGASPSLSNSSASGRRRRQLGADFNTSIDLTSKDAIFLPEIVKAAQSGTREDIERLVIQGNDLEVRDTTWGRNALLIAAHCGKEDIVDLLLRNNAQVAVTDGSGWTALHLAASRGHYGAVELLVVESDLMEVQTPRGETALRIAADYGQADALLVLLNYHAQVNARAEKQLTALHAAAKRGDHEIVWLMVRYGADVEAKDGTMMTALHYACREGHLEVMKILLDNKANIEALGDDRKTPLICAAEAGSSQAVEFLLKRKASSRKTDDTGMTALHWAAYNGHEETVRILSEKKKVLLDMANESGRTALHLAVMQSNFAVVELLQRKGMSLDRRCNTGLTALHYACMADSFEIANLLLLSGADIEAAESQHEQRSLHIVASKGSIHILDLLCDKGASLNARNGVGDRALCVASRYGHTATVQRLLDRGSPLSMKFETSLREDSPLCLAAQGGHLNLCSLLLNRGASALKKDETGWQPYHHAAHHGHADILEFILSRSNILETGKTDLMSIPKTIGWSPSVSEDKKIEVLQLLKQTLNPANSYTTSSTSNSTQNYFQHPSQRLSQHLDQPSVNLPAQFPTHSPMPQASSPHHSITTAYRPPVFHYSIPIPTAYEADSSTPQELPGSLDLDSSSTRSIGPENTPTNVHAALARDISRTGILKTRQSNEPTAPLTNDRIAALARETQGTPGSQSQQHRGRRSPTRFPSHNLPRVHANYSPISLPPPPSPSIHPPQSLPYRTGNQTSLKISPLNSERFVEISQIPGSLLARQYTVSRTGSEGLDEGRYDDSSDTDSISSVYTAPEGEEPGMPTHLESHEKVTLV